MKTQLKQAAAFAGRARERAGRWVLAPFVAAACSPVFAQSVGGTQGLPTMNTPNEALGGGSVADGDWLGAFGSWLRAGLTILALVLVSLGFIYAIAGFLNRWRGYSGGRNEMSDVIEYAAMCGVFGVVLVVLATYSLNILTGQT